MLTGHDRAADQSAGNRPGSWAALWRTLTRFQRDKITPWIGVRNAIGVALPLAGAAAAGSIRGGLAIGTGSLNVAFSDNSDPYIVRAWRMLVSSVLVGCAVAAGEICGRDHVLAVAVASAWAFSAGILVALSTTAADLGAMSLVTLIVYSSVPAAPSHAALAGLLAFGGGLLQTALSLALWPMRRYEPQRRALADLYAELARAAALPAQAMSAPAASSKATQAQQALTGLGRDESIEGERYRALLSQAERTRLSLMTLARLRARMHREAEGCPECNMLDGYFETANRLLTAIGDALAGGGRANPRPEYLGELQALAASLRAAGEGRPASMGAMLADSRRQMDALNGQFRAALDLAAHVTPEGIEAFERREARRPWSLRLMGTAATVRANLSLESAACRHAIRLAACVALGDTIARSFGFGRYYWLPMTVAIVLKPDFTATFSRGVLRLAGTFIGLVMATAIFHLLPVNPWVEIGIIFALTFGMRGFGGANYGILVIAMTGIVVLLVAMTGVPPSVVIAARGWNTAVGGSIALLAYWLWPTWERRQAPETLARLLDAYREYFHAIRMNYQDPSGSKAAGLDRARHSARLARSNFEASVDRLMAEPGKRTELAQVAHGILANSHRLVHALMALEAGLASSHPVPAREKFGTFANQVEFTLYYVAAGLRGSPVARAQLPDLREAHNALVKSGDSLTERYALVNIETDRITNSLNTLSEEILSLVGNGAS